MKYDIESINKRKKTVKKAKKILEVFCIIFIYNLILIIISYYNFNNNVELFGHRAYIITSNSMEPNLSFGDIVITQRCNEEKIYEGDIITFKQEKENITHRIIKIENYDSGLLYVTKGDNNNLEDIEKIEYSQIQGKVILIIPYLGNIIMLLNNEIIILIILLILLVLFLLYIQKQEKIENRREKKKIEAERQENKQNT